MCRPRGLRRPRHIRDGSLLHSFPRLISKYHEVSTYKHKSDCSRMTPDHFVLIPPPRDTGLSSSLRPLRSQGVFPQPFCMSCIWPRDRSSKEFFHPSVLATYGISNMPLHKIIFLSNSSYSYQLLSTSECGVNLKSRIFSIWTVTFLRI